MTANFPPPFEVFEHTMFYDIDVLPPTVKPVELKESDKKGQNSSDKGHNASDMALSKMSPKAQMKHGVDSADVTCRDGFELVMKNSNDSAACINSHSVEKLIQRGWASQF
jgi:hypothetical protein